MLLVCHITCVETLEAGKIPCIQGTFYWYGDSLTAFLSNLLNKMLHMAHDMLRMTHKGLFTNYFSHIWGGLEVACFLSREVARFFFVPRGCVIFFLSQEVA